MSTRSADTLGKYTVICTAFAGSDYYATSVSSEFQAIEAAVALTGVAPAAEITVKGKTWKAQNVNHASMGRCFRNSPVLDDVMGRLFTWEEAQTVCPDGWHLPTVAEFETSFAGEDGTIAAGDLMADAYMFDEKLWEYWPQVKITNSTRMAVLPAGYVVVSGHNKFTGFQDYAAFWTADSDPDDDTKALYRYINVNDPEALHIVISTVTLRL